MARKRKPKQQLPLTEFGKDREDLDYKTFCKPDVKYFVTTYKGRGTRQKQKFRTFPEALVVCVYLTTIKEQPALLYVEGPDNYGFCVPWNAFPQYLKVYNELTGQTLGMPLYYKPKDHSYDR